MITDHPQQVEEGDGDDWRGKLKSTVTCVFGSVHQNPQPAWDSLDNELLKERVTHT